MIELKNVSTAVASRVVSENISLKISRGELVSFIGPNGCGKTTLLKTLCRLLPAKSGEIVIGGKNIEAFTRRELAQTVSFLPQVRPVPDISAGALVSHGRFPYLGFSRKLTENDREKVSAALALAGIAELKARSVASLSGGERQKVYIAMTLAQDTPVTVWDEPTTFLDINAQLDILALAQRLRDAGKTVLLSLHDISSALEISDKICVLGSRGEISAFDTPENIYASGVIEKLYNIHSGKTENENRTHYYFYR